ncbi:MAG: helicase, superfamily [Mycobacterium sp.]|nr:helicase, superfamily [Mycobacterium sp.]
MLATAVGVLKDIAPRCPRNPLTSRFVDMGVYESLLTARLNQQLKQRDDLRAEYGAVDEAEQSLTIARHLAPIIERSLRAAGTAEERAELTRRILAVLPDVYADGETLHPFEPGKITRLDEVAGGTVLGGARLPRPATPFSDAALMTNARNEPTLAAELRTELASADHVDLLCAFVKWQGLRLLEDQLNELCQRGTPLRVITTTYLGATDARALDALVNEFGAEVRVNYETDRTRLHAKAWLLRRNTGFHTAYVGSSNLSHAALVDGLEWNVRLSAMSTPHLLEKFRATFDSYWENREFEPYLPAEDGDRLRAALETASGTRSSDRLIVALSGLEVHPKPYQAEMLEQLDAERTIHDRHRNLIVAATGTGKTVIAALDYRRLARDIHGRDLTLLFVAHRKEILMQSRRMYQEVLTDPTFGDLLVDGQEPSKWRHVFASIQSLTQSRLSGIKPDRFDLVVVDEFHHAEAASYRRLLDHVQPIELVGLTATPERGDGVDVRDFFGGRVAAELRLWEALEQNLLCPFHYFGIHDGTDLEAVQWRRGGYDLLALSNVYTGDDARTRIVLKELNDKVADVAAMRALGFCVSVEHAHYMAQHFVEAGIPALAVSAETSAADRRDALTALRNREINILFAVDLFNEGLDIPEVDTVLFLRPTESATVFLQQLGRGLRLTRGKTVLTALDFVGHQRKEFRFDQRFRALTGVGGKALQRQVQEGFPFLPSGSQIVLDSVARELVLENIRQQVAPRWAALVSEVRAHPDDRLASFLDASGRALEDVLKNNRSWTTLCRDAGKLGAEAAPCEADLVKRVRAVAHVDDRRRWASYNAILDGTAATDSPAERRLAEMLFYSLFPHGGGFDSAAAGLELLKDDAVADELRQVIDIAFDSARRSTYELGSLAPALAGVPLEVHASYSREEILAALGFASQRRTPSTMREGVAWCEGVNSDAFLITLKKSDRDYSPTTMYRDFALSPTLFHWESQSTTSSASPTGQRYIHHSERGSHILLFVRGAKTTALGTSPYVFLGPADYVSHEGDRPMAITWRLHRPMPTEVYQASTVAVA